MIINIVKIKIDILNLRDYISRQNKVELCQVPLILINEIKDLNLHRFISLLDDVCQRSFVGPFFIPKSQVALAKFLKYMLLSFILDTL